ncbi:hypothetical protein AAFC00_005163 [Neodothiora populina]|uniref:Uncharacterized protein n=1 Tax=Neodothiora populina TaxID=2781224 RepID=A0ABR3PJZ9_9PEZI
MSRRRDVRTAKLEESIWRDLPELEFRQHLVELEGKTNAVPIDPQIFDITHHHGRNEQPDTTTYTLPIEVEQRLADDLAFLAAVEEGAQSVAAVCIEEQVSPQSFIFRSAALDTALNDTVKYALEDILCALSALVEDPSKNKDEYIDLLFRKIITLHHHRLLARLRSSKWEKPKHLARSHKKPLWGDFANLIHRAQFLYTKKEKAARLRAEQRLQSLAQVYADFEDETSDQQQALMRLVRASLEFCQTEEIRDYTRRLEINSNNSTEASKPPTKQISSAMKCLRQIEKIAAYLRISISLVQTASTYPQVFASPLLAYITPYDSVPTTIGYEEWAKTCHVHAEVQLAVYYDLETQSQHSTTEPATLLHPRTIGASKYLCYLCFRFLSAHAHFAPSKTHGRLYDQWTVPDLAEYTPDTRRRYREIVEAMDREVVGAAAAICSGHQQLWRVEPMTSRQDLRLYGAGDGEVDGIKEEVN